MTYYRPSVAEVNAWQNRQKTLLSMGRPVEPVPANWIITESFTLKLEASFGDLPEAKDDYTQTDDIPSVTGENGAVNGVGKKTFTFPYSEPGDPETTTKELNLPLVIATVIGLYYALA